MRTFLKAWQFRLGLALVALPIVGYFIHYAVFRDVHHIFLYLIGDIAFVFLEVLMVTLIIHELLSRQEKPKRMEKLNMVAGAFFSEVGASLLRLLSDLDTGLGATREQLHVATLWTEEQFDSVALSMKSHPYLVNPSSVEEMVARTEEGELPESDVRHLAGDVDRVYGQLAMFWLDYMKYLKANYPYLFSLAVRMNPFDQCASPVVR